jgi:hypothetical protein
MAAKLPRAREPQTHLRSSHMKNWSATTWFSALQQYCCRVLPSFDSTSGNLPPGEHHATWDEVLDRFGWTPWRRRLLDGIAESIELLVDAGCQRIWLNGSFVTEKEEPGDFDAVWDPEQVDDDLLDPIFGPLGMLHGRRLQKERFGGEWFPNINESQNQTTFATFFQRDRNSISKGIVVLDLTHWRQP